MLVRFVESYRRGADLLLPGERLDVPGDEATALIELGIAVPVPVGEQERVVAERR